MASRSELEIGFCGLYPFFDSFASFLKRRSRRLDGIMKVVQEGSCSCGAVTVQTVTEPITTFNCHCSNCRGFYKKDFAQPGAYWELAVSSQGPVHYTTTYAGGPMGYLIMLRRGRCAKCRDPVFAHGARACTGVVFVSTQVLRFEPKFNLYYDSGLRKGTMGLLTKRSEISSSLYVTAQLIYPGLIQLVSLLRNRALESLSGATLGMKKD